MSGLLDITTRHLDVRRRVAPIVAVSSIATIGVVASASPAGAALDPAEQVCFTVSGGSDDAAIVNLTPVLPSASGDGQLISSDIKHSVPKASNTNFRPGVVDPNVAIAPIGSDAQVCFQNSVHAEVDLIADHLGTIEHTAYTPAQPNGAPARVVDTRKQQGGTRLAPSGQLCFTVNGTPGDAAVVNLTPVLATAPGDGQLISSDVRNNVPTASNTNFGPGTVDPNVAIAPIGTDGRVCFQNSTHAAVDLIADHLGTIDHTAYTPANDNGAPERVIDSRFDPINVRSECAVPATTAYDTITSQTMYGLASRAYEVEPGRVSPGKPLDEYGSGIVHFQDRMGCWELIAAIRGGHPSLGSVTDTEVIVARNVDTHDLAVAFRGTELNLADILTDISVARAPWPLPDGRVVDAAVHSGFAGAYLAVRDQLVEVLRAEHTARMNGSRVFFTGHSLGGALATIGSLDLVDDLMALGYTRHEVATYTYGAPRSLSEQMSNHHASFVPVSYAVVNPNDPVPHVPSAIGGNPYSHIRQMVVLHALDHTTRVRRNTGDGRDYGGCLYLVPDVTNHVRSEYFLRVGATHYYPAPRVWVTRQDVLWPAIDNIRMHWDADVEGACDQVAIWNRSSAPTSLSGAIRDRWAFIDTNDQHTTTVNVDDANWIGYVDMFGKVISASRFDLEP